MNSNLPWGHPSQNQLKMRKLGRQNSWRYGVGTLKDRCVNFLLLFFSFFFFSSVFIILSWLESDLNVASNVHLYPMLLSDINFSANIESVVWMSDVVNPPNGSRLWQARNRRSDERAIVRVDSFKGLMKCRLCRTWRPDFNTPQKNQQQKTNKQKHTHTHTKKTNKKTPQQQKQNNNNNNQQQPKTKPKQNKVSLKGVNEF